jgi:hypothetical protein
MTIRALRSALALLLVIAILVSGYAYPILAGQPITSVVYAAEPVETTRTITVVGEGKVTIEPDVARATFGVEVLKPTVKEAMADNKTTMDAVLAALRGQGIEDKDIQTTGFAIYAERYGPQGPLPEDQVNYRVTNNVTVVIRDLESVGVVIDAAVEAGANNIYGIEFRIDDPNKLESQARKGAIEDAKAKAEELAELTGVTVGMVISVSEVIANGGYFASNFAQRTDFGGGGGGAAPIAPGQLDLIMQLQVTYAIAE